MAIGKMVKLVVPMIIASVLLCGSGEGEFAKDISKWSHLREIPAMKTYYNNMPSAKKGIKGTELFMYIRNEQIEKLCHWKADEFPPITEGRIGLRHMWTRNAQYRDFRISVLGAHP